MYSLQGTPLNSTIASIDDYSQNKGKGGHKITHGYYKISSQRRTAKYVYIPENLLSGPNFQFDEVFAALGLYVPNLIFEINGSQEPNDWNVRLPSYKAGLVGQSYEYSGALKHYKGVVSGKLFIYRIN